MDSSRASKLELLWGLPTSREVLQPSKPRLSLLYKNELGSTIGGLNLNLFILSTRGSTGVFLEGLRWSSSQRLGMWGPLVRQASHATWLDGQVSSLHRLWALGTLSIASTGHIDKMFFVNAPTHGRSAKVMSPTGHTLAQLSPCFVPCHFHMSYCLWLCLILNIMKICMDFGSYGAFPSSDVPEMVDQQNSWNLLVISIYLLYLEWNVGMLVTPPTLRVLFIPEQKKSIKSSGHKQEL
jgi:hypothetical protein